LTETATHSRQILKSAFVLGFITAICRVLGYLRGQCLAHLLSTPGLADTFIIAYRIPNILRRLPGEGLLTASSISVFSDCAARGSLAAARLAGQGHEIREVRAVAVRRDLIQFGKWV